MVYSRFNSVRPVTPVNAPSEEPSVRGHGQGRGRGRTRVRGRERVAPIGNEVPV